MYRISQVTYTLDQTCCTVTCTLDLTRPSPACRISRRAPVCNQAHWKIWSVVAVAAYKVSSEPP